MSEAKILTLHPAGKNGVNISKAKYDTMRDAILQMLEREGDLAFMELARRLEAALEGNFEGSISWYAVSVKLDLEARGILKARPKTKPPRWYVDRDAL